MQNNLKPYFLLILSLLLPSCSRLFNWGRKTFDQACVVENATKEMRCYIRSAHVYDQLSTLAIFDAMLLTNEATKLAKGKPFRETSFFVLGFAPRTDRRPLNAGSTNQWGWDLSMLVNGNKLKPVEFKCVDMPGEYKLLFGSRWSQFKNSYFVTFDYKIKPSDEVILCFDSLRKKTALVWNFKDGKLECQKKECCYKKDCCKC